MLLRIVSLCTCLFVMSWAEAQINIQWEARLDGAGSFVDKVEDMELDGDGNTYVTGTSYSGTSFDLVTVKYNADGTEIWRSTYGGSGIDEAHALALDGSNNVIVTGARFISGDDWDVVTIKYDGVTGAELWSVIHSGSTDFDLGRDVAVDGSDNIVVVGSLYMGPANINMLILKYDPSGTLLWSDDIGASGSDEAQAVSIDASDNIFVGGHFQNSIASTYFDFYLTKYNAAGTVLWGVSEDSGFENLDRPEAMTLDASGDVILAGRGFTDILNEEDYLTMKFSGATGALEWKELYAGNAEAVDVVNAVVTDAAGNIYVTGRSKSTETSEDFYTIAYDNAGTEIWSDRFSTEGLEYDEATDIRISDSETYVYVTGYSYYPATNNDFTTIKYNAATGVREWITIFDGPSSNSDQALVMQLDATENIFIAGNSHGGVTNLDYSIIKYCQLTTEASPDTAVCIGESVELSATGGEDITWEVLSGDAGSMSCSVCETMVATPDETTVYIVHSTSLSGCVDYDTVEVVVNLNPVPVIYHDTPLTFCDGDSVVLYTDTYVDYAWTGGSTDSFTVALATDTYSLTITDANGCSGSATIDVLVHDLPTVDVGDDLAVCPDNSVLLNATGAVTYLWDVDPTLSVLLGPNPTASPVVDTEYYVTGTDDNGCQNRDSLTVVVHELPSVNAGADATICVEDSVHLMATGATTYEWDFSASLSALDIADPWAFPTSITEYFVTGTDDNGCQNRDSITVATLSLPTINAGNDTVICAGLSVMLSASGGLPDLYVWNDDPTLSETDVFDPIATPLTATEYIVEGTDVNGCSNVDTVLVDLYTLPPVSAGPDDAICLEDSVQLEASGALTYVWDTDPSLSALDIFDPWASPLATKTYTVTGTDINGCVNEDEVTITVNELPTISAGPDAVICEGDSTQLMAAGGTIYVWEFDPTLSNFVIGDPWAKPTVTTTYIVEGTDGAGCSGTDEVVVTVNPIPAPPVLTHEGPWIFSSYEEGNQWWHDGAELDGETNDSLHYPTIGENGEYWVVYTDENGCSVESDRIENPIFITDVGIEELDAQSIRIYPNPSAGVLFIQLDQNIDAIRLYSMNGGQLLNWLDLAAGTTEIDLSDLPSGTYALQFIRDNKVTVKKVVKQ